MFKIGDKVRIIENPFGNKVTDKVYLVSATGAKLAWIYPVDGLRAYAGYIDQRALALVETA